MLNVCLTSHLHPLVVTFSESDLKTLKKSSTKNKFFGFFKVLPFPFSLFYRSEQKLSQPSLLSLSRWTTPSSIPWTCAPPPPPLSLRDLPKCLPPTYDFSLFPDLFRLAVLAPSCSQFLLDVEYDLITGQVIQTSAVSNTDGGISLFSLIISIRPSGHEWGPLLRLGRRFERASPFPQQYILLSLLPFPRACAWAPHEEEGEGQHLLQQLLHRRVSLSPHCPSFSVASFVVLFFSIQCFCPV